MKTIPQAEISALRRFIASNRTSDDLKKSFKTVLDKYKIPYEAQRTNNAEKKGIEEDILSLEALLPYSSEMEKKEIESDITDLKILLKYV